jgi:hypothetical protein
MVPSSSGQCSRRRTLHLPEDGDTTIHRNSGNDRSTTRRLIPEYLNLPFLCLMIELVFYSAEPNYDKCIDMKLKLFASHIFEDLRGSLLNSKDKDFKLKIY